MSHARKRNYLELKLLIAEEMWARGRPIAPGDVIITHGCGPGAWGAVILRTPDCEAPPTADLHEVEENFAKRYELIGAPG